MPRSAAGTHPSDPRTRSCYRGMLLLCCVQLGLNNNNIGDAGATELAKALANNRTLTAVR